MFNNSYSSNGSVAISGDKILEGASLKDDTFSFELRENGELIETVKNKGGKVNFSPLVYSIEDAGIHTYTVTEKQEGMAGITYDTHTAEVKVEVTDNGDGTLRAEMLTDNFTFNNSFAKEVNISKTDLGGNELEGAHIVVTGDDFKEEWDSTKEPHKLTLAEGTYTLQETVAPVGYDKITTTVEFEVKADATVKLNTTTVDNVETDGNGNIVLKNNAKKHNVKINKTDLNGAEIENATIKVTGTDLEGNSVNEEWVSKKNETFDLELKAGNYTFEEVSAPVGYVKVDTKVDFTVEKDGTVNISNTEVAPAGAVEYKDGIIILKDKIKEYDINISKTDLGGEEVEGAQISVYENDKKIDSWTSSKEAHTITLAPGTYVMKEEVAPAGFKKITTNIQFEVALDGSVSLITTSVENGKVEIKEDGTIILMDEPEEPPTEPVEEPSEPKEEPTEPVEEPTEEPTQPVEKPTETPIETPTEQPTEPVEEPTETPTEPVIEPTEEPIETPIEEPIIEQIEPIIEPIIEEEVPETGDTNLLPLWIALMAVSAVTLTGVIVKRRKNQ